MKDNKGFTLVEVIVSFSLITIVIIYLLKTVLVINDEQSNIMLEQNFSVYQSNILDKIYNDIYNAKNIKITYNDNVITFTSDDFIEQNIQLVLNDDSIIYDNVIYQLPEGFEFLSPKYELINDETYEIIKINFKTYKENKSMKIIIKLNN